MVIRPSTSFPPPPLRFRTAGFPQYGSKRVFKTPPSPPSQRAYRRLHSSSGVHPHFVRLFGLASHPNVPNTDSDALVQWPLAPPAVMLSASLIAYYGHIRASAPLRQLYVLMADGLCATQKVPTFICQSLMTCRRPYSDGSRESPTNPNSWLGLRLFTRGSATICLHTPDYVWYLSRSCNVHIPLRPAISLAPLRTGLLQPSLPAPDRSKDRSVMTTGTFVSFLTGLSPAALSALWAARETNTSNATRAAESAVAVLSDFNSENGLSILLADLTA
jgi:hypothetical protein